jgi:hypothetical protein
MFAEFLFVGWVCIMVCVGLSIAWSAWRLLATFFALAVHITGGRPEERPEKERQN